MNKLLQHIIDAGDVDHRVLPGLQKMQTGGKAIPKRGQNVIVDGQKMNTYSDEYENAYNKGIGQWVNYDKGSKQWKPLPANLPNSAYANAEFVSNPVTLPEVTVTSKMNPYMSAARKKAKEQAGALEAFRKQEEAGYPKWYKNSTLYNPEKDKETQEDHYNTWVNRSTYQNLVDNIPQKENESRIDYINRFNNLAGKNAVSSAREANVTEPFDPSQLAKLGQWGWKGLNHIGAGTQALFTSNPTDFMSTMRRGIDRGNQPTYGMLPDEAKEVGVFQPFETMDDLAYKYAFRPALKGYDNFVDPKNKQARNFGSRYLGASDTDKMFTSFLNPLNYITGSELLSGGKGLAKAARVGEGLETAGKFLTESTPLRNAYKINPYAEKLTGKIQRQIFGDPAYESFLKYGPTTQPERPAASQQAQWLKFNREASPVTNTGTGENMQIAGTTRFENNGLRIEEDYPFAYFSEGSPWYGPKRSSSMVEALGQERRLVPKEGANLNFHPAGESSIIMNPEELTKETINSYAGRRRVLSPFQDAFKPEAFDVYNAQPHWRKGYQKITNPESIIKPKPIVEPEVRFGRDDMGMFRRRGDSKTYILNNDGELGDSNAVSLRHPGFLNETEYNQLQDLYNRPGVRENLQKEYSRMNLITDDYGNVPVLEHHLSSRNNYNDFVENQAEKAFYTKDNPVNNNGWPQGYSIGDSYSNSPSFADMYNNSLKRKFNLGLEKIDKSLGSLIPSKKAPSVNYEELENAINKRLISGMGIKKTSEPLSIKISKASDNVFPNEFQTYINGQRSGGIGLRQNMDAYSNNRKLSEVLFPNAQAAWRSAPGFRKTGDYPFNLTGKADEYYNKGLSGEFNAAINDVLKEKGYGNVLSGGTGHTPLGKSRWENLVNKGVAEKFGEKYGESFYKLKEDGGPIVDSRGQWAHPGKVTRIPGSDITMQGVSYPVLGIGSNGKKMIMYPNQNYSFGGAQHVDEYPMMQNGGNTLPEVTVYGHRNRTAKAYFDRWRKEAEDWQDRESPVNSPMSSYLAGEQMYSKYKGHDIKMLDKQERPMLSVTPFGDTLQIHNPESDYRGDSLISELAHKVQLNKKGNLGFITSHIGNDYLNTLKNMSLSDMFNADSWKNAYDKNYYAPGTQEYEAHSIIEPKLREEFKILADKEYDKLTAYKNKMKNGGQHGGLDRWFAEKWVDVKTGKACGRQEGESRAGYPACRPSKRVNSQTPKTASELSTAEREKFKRNKTSSQRINYNHKRNK